MLWSHVVRLRSTAVMRAACLLPLACMLRQECARSFAPLPRHQRVRMRHMLCAGGDAAPRPMTYGSQQDGTRAIKLGNNFDQQAVDTACAALSASVASGNRYHFDALVTVLRVMMPPAGGATQVRGPPREATLDKEDLMWSEHDFMSGPEENLRVLQDFEAQMAERTASAADGFRDPVVLGCALDLAVAYLKNYALDKADALYAAIEPYCMERGLPWDVKCLQDMATLRCKQARQPEAAVLLEEVAKRSPPHPATLNNLGTVYNMMGQHERAQEYFQAAMELAGHEEPEKDDLWNMGIAKKHMGQYDEALPMLIRALEGWIRDDPKDDVTIAKLHDTVGSCYDLMGRHDEAVEQYSRARYLFGRSIGEESPLYGSACEGRTKSLIHGGRYEEGFEQLRETLLNTASKDAVHPTPLFELLGYALEDCVTTGGLDPQVLERLEEPIEIAVKNMVYRGIDQDGNAGVVFERMAQALLRCSLAQGDAQQQKDAARRRELARYLLGRAGPLVAASTQAGEADLTHISRLIELEGQVLDNQDALYRTALPGAPAQPPLQLPGVAAY
mmetsp:Transcript_46807/g.102274  ORF Transcript_46807/g.102274 Transcript_46807/m.102274 type:complete len:560 (-) Transcript_46807:67-1746(-)